MLGRRPMDQRGSATWDQGGRDKPLRCKATHDVPWSERCLMNVGHSGDHMDKAGREWKATR